MRKADRSGERPARDDSRRRRALLAVVLAALAAAIAVPALAVTRDGSDDDETLRGTAKADVLRGQGGNDVLLGYRGNDRLYGGPGNDRLYGGPGSDRLYGGPGDDRLYGGPGRDLLVGGPGNDRIYARDGQRDDVVCGPGRDTAWVDAIDRVRPDCETVRVAPGQQPDQGGSQGEPDPAKQVVLEETPWACTGPVDLDLVKVTLRNVVEDAIRLDQNCTGRIGRVEVETWTADGIKVQNRGVVAHDLVIESGFVKCHAIHGDVHQDGIQAMGGSNITFRNLRVDCLGNSNLFIGRGGSGASTPTGVVCEGCVLGPNSGQTVLVGPSVRSGARRTTICEGRFRAATLQPTAEGVVNARNRVLPPGSRACADVTGRG